MKLVFVFLCFFKYVFGSPPFVELEQGKLLGTEYTLSNGKVLNAFLGVPYAAAPVSEYRFKEPQTLEPSNDIWDATFTRSECLQTAGLGDNYFIIGEEDCLYLNIYTPKLSVGGKRSLLDVFVYLHGGGFAFGTGNIFPDRILGTEDVIFISMNYRLGAFGFLTTNDSVAPGNFGLKDQVAALKWIKRNIVNFGGNPESVTIAGLSSGAACVHLHMLSSLSKGLFQKAISISGTALNPWAMFNKVEQKSRKLASLVECPQDDSQSMVTCLRTKPATEILQAYRTIAADTTPPFVFGPTTEPESSVAFLSIRPADILKKEVVNDVPWLSSMVKDEGLFPTAAFMKSDLYLYKINQEWNEMAPKSLGYDYAHLTDDEKLIISSAIKEYYFGENPISKDSIEQLIQLVGDREFYNGIIDATQQHNLVSKSNVYCIKFNYRGERSYTNILASDFENYGVCHADDAQYSIKFFPGDELSTDSDLKVSKLMVTIITDFMRTGNPNGVFNKWESIVKEANRDLNCLHIYSDTNMEMKDVEVNSPRHDFWKALLPFE